MNNTIFVLFTPLTLQLTLSWRDFFSENSSSLIIDMFRIVPSIFLIVNLTPSQATMRQLGEKLKPSLVLIGVGSSGMEISSEKINGFRSAYTKKVTHKHSHRRVIWIIPSKTSILTEPRANPVISAVS